MLLTLERVHDFGRALDRMHPSKRAGFVDSFYARIHAGYLQWDAEPSAVIAAAALLARNGFEPHAAKVLGGLNDAIGKRTPPQSIDDIIGRNVGVTFEMPDSKMPPNEVSFVFFVPDAPEGPSLYVARGISVDLIRVSPSGFNGYGRIDVTYSSNFHPLRSADDLTTHFTTEYRRPDAAFARTSDGRPIYVDQLQLLVTRALTLFGDVRSVHRAKDLDAWRDKMLPAIMTNSYNSATAEGRARIEGDVHRTIYAIDSSSALIPAIATNGSSHIPLDGPSGFYGTPEGIQAAIKANRAVGSVGGGEASKIAYVTSSGMQVMGFPTASLK